MIEDDCTDKGMSTMPSPMRKSPRMILRPGIRIWFDSRVSEFGDSVGGGDGQLQVSSCSISSGATTGGGGSCCSSLGHSLDSASGTNATASVATSLSGCSKP
ncbi:hypothetical protein C1H46_012135 [Malus baccata]|uniref:Uncharacterized protein n=1 Tax=Malus baccata TaxID=106549 RepID=A0A540MTZ3_MALBA|nr:hypothetical protein C1H46_012135 [Malus baccata]